MGAREKQGEEFNLRLSFEISDSFYKARCSYSLKASLSGKVTWTSAKDLRFVPSNYIS